METLNVKILEPKIRQLLEDLEDLKLIELRKEDEPNKPKRRFGAMKGLVEYIADDFNAPLDDFKEYM